MQEKVEANGARLPAWDILSRLLTVVSTLMLLEGVFLWILYAFKVREYSLPGLAIPAKLGYIRNKPYVETLLFLWIAWTAHGFDQEFNSANRDFVRDFQEYFTWMVQAPPPFEIIEDNAWAWPFAAQMSMLYRRKDIKSVGKFKTALCSRMLAFGNPSLDVPLSWTKPTSDYWYRECIREINVLASIWCLWYFSCDRDMTLRFFYVVLEPVALWLCIVVAEKVFSRFFRHQDDNHEGFWYLPKSLRYRLNVGKIAVVRVMLLGQEFISFIEEDWSERYQLARRRYERRSHMAKAFFVAFGWALRWIGGVVSTGEGNSAPFRYKALGSDQIRLLRVRKRTLFRPPRCDLIVMSPLDASDYVACSYVWGDATRQKEITLDGCKFLTTDSAYQVIRRKQSFFGESKIWIDSICINQDNAREKAAQIRRMRGIFRNAEHVDAYINAEKNSSTIKFFMEQLKGEAEGETMAEDVFLPSDYHIRELANFICNPWFSRIWVLQEVAVARKLLITNGTDVFDWEQFVAALSFFRSRPVLLKRLQTEIYKTEGTDGETSSAFSLPLNMNAIRKGVLIDDHLPLLNLLNTSRHCKFSEPLDRIFALLGMAPGDCVRAIDVDYGASSRDLYTKAMEYLLTCVDMESGGLQLLANAGLQQGPESSQLPSWVSAWARPSQDRLCEVNLTALWLLANRPDPVFYSVNGYELTCETNRVGKISKLFGSVIPEDIAKLENFTVTKSVAFQSERSAIYLGAQDAAKYFERDLVDDLTELAFLEPTLAPLTALIESTALFVNLAAGIPDTAIRRKVSTLLLGGLLKNPFEKVGTGLKKLRAAMEILFGKASSSPDLQDLTTSEREVYRNLAGKRFAAIGDKLSLVPRAALDEDEVYFIAGAQTPFVLRPVSATEESTGIRRFQLVGACYVCHALPGRPADEKEDDNKGGERENIWQKILLV